MFRMDRIDFRMEFSLGIDSWPAIEPKPDSEQAVCDAERPVFAAKNRAKRRFQWNAHRSRFGTSDRRGQLELGMSTQPPIVAGFCTQTRSRFSCAPCSEACVATA